MQDPISQIDAALLLLACPENNLAELAFWSPHIRKSCQRWGVDTVREVSAFLAQGGHESRGLTHLTEDLTYTHPERIQAVYGKKRFPTVASAIPYVRNPKALANYVYANRMGNGSEATGDGWTFRGAGVFQLTGRDNHARFAKDMGMSLADVPAYLQTREGAAQSAGWFWKVNNLDPLAATPGVEDETQRINGGQNGVEDRRSRFNRVLTELLKRGC